MQAIRDFNAGYLDASPGTTLRTFLSDKLQCDPMRITKKFTGVRVKFHCVVSIVPPTAQHSLFNCVLNCMITFSPETATHHATRMQALGRRCSLFDD